MKAGLKRAALQLDRYRQRNPHVVRLACLASLAVRVESYLLRTLRQDLLPDVDVGVEADLWFSPLVESRGVDAVVLDAKIVALLRQELANDRALLRRALEITQRLHRCAPPSLQLEELINAVALLDEGDPVATINKALRPALRSILEGGERAREVAQWAMRALPRSHATVCRSESALSLLLAASSVLGGRRLVKEVPEIRMPLRRIGWALPEQALSERISLGVELLERGVRFSRSGSDRPGIDLPRTDPIIVELEWSRGGERVGLLVEAKEGRTIDIEDEISELTLRSLSGDEYEIARVAMATEAVPSIEAASGFIRRGVASLEDPVIAIAWSPDGESLAFAVQGGMLYVVASRQLLATVPGELVEHASKAHLQIEDEASLTSIAWSSDGKYLGVGVDSGNVAIVDAHSFRTVFFIEMPAANPSRIAWSPNGTLLAAAVEGSVSIWEVSSGKWRARLYTEEANAGGLAFSPDGRQFAATGVRRVTIWDTESFQILRRSAPSVWDELTCLAWNPRGDRLAMATGRGGIAVWQLSDRDVPRIDQTGMNRIQNLAFSSDGRFLLGIDEVGSMTLWNPLEGRTLAAFSTTDGRRAVSALRVSGPSAAIWRTDGLVTVWDVGPDVFDQQKAAKGTCFVTMGFGKKTDFQSGRILDLDKSYQGLIKPAVEAAGLECLRADEILRSGVIDVPMFDRLLNADAVVADISTFNRNALYELGVRHALRPYTTVVIAEEGMMRMPPFDTNLIRIWSYRHLGYDIGVDEASRFRTELTEAIQRALDKPEVDSPVYRLLPKLIPARIAIQGTPGQADVDERFLSHDQAPSVKEGRCFVAMGFGKKTDFETGHILDMDRSYLDLIKPAVEAAGLRCFRADETVNSGLIDVPMYEQLLNADVVVADLSSSNSDAFYQLGLRHALRPYTTIVIAEEGMVKATPFDTNLIRIRTYRHRIKDIDIDEARRFRKELTEAIREALDKPEVDSPVYSLLPDLIPPRLKKLSVFISYRRDDSLAWAGRLYDHLTAHFASNEIFMDVDTFEPGVDFVKAIEQSVSSCDVLIAVIGKHWLTSSVEEGQRRIDNPEDFVRMEIATALKRDIRVIPVLVDGASMPRSVELPDDVKALARRHALEVSHARFKADSERLIDAVERVLRTPRTEETPPPPERPADSPEAASPRPSGGINATKLRPFVNSLGMRFVPVPGTNVLFSVWETRVEDYQRSRGWLRSLFGRHTRFPQTGDHPVVNVSWKDATAFCEWLSRKEGNKYRLPTDHEWSCAVGIGHREDAAAPPKSKSMKIANVFPWGGQWPPPNDAGNYCGQECKTPAALAALKAAGYNPSKWAVIEGFSDGNVFTAAVGSFRPNELGICDLGGNVWEWCQDEYEPRSASRVLRGGSWCDINRDFVLSSYRCSYDPDGRGENVGFRAVVEAGSGR